MQLCGICKRAPRIGEETHKVRLEAADMEGKKYPEPKKPGLYQCCQECFDEYKPVVAARLGRKAEELGGYDVI